LESLIRTAIDQNEAFLTLTLEEQREALSTLAKTLVPAEEAPRTMTPQSVMNARTAVPAPAEEEEEEEEEEETT
jgi:hypothetical protein